MLSKLKLARLKKGYKAKEVAKNLHISPSYISMVENGSRILSQDLLLKLAQLYEVSPRDLI